MKIGHRLGKPKAKAWLSTAVWNSIIQEAERMHPLETGGVLIGYWTHPQAIASENMTVPTGVCADVVVMDVRGPGPCALHGHCSFTPDHDFDADQIAEAYSASNRSHVYLGDWHTHPGGGTTLSWKDRRTLTRIARSPTARCPQPIMLVLNDDTPPAISIWSASPSKLIRSPWNNLHSMDITIFGI